MKDSNSIDSDARNQYKRFEKNPIRRIFLTIISPLVSKPLNRQRVKLLYFMFGYIPLLSIKEFSVGERLSLLGKFLRIDWNVLHGHLPSEISHITTALARRSAKQPGEAVVEAGCWNGGSSAKFSILCKRFGYHLHIYDSFEGVEMLNGEDQAKEWDYGGQYAAQEDVVKSNLKQYGCPEVCTTYKGWFSETLAVGPVPYPVRLAYIDCDLGKGTREALQGIMPSLVSDGDIFTQDFHIDPVREVLLDPETWESLKVAKPNIQQKGVHLAHLQWEQKSS